MPTGFGRSCGVIAMIIEEFWSDPEHSKSRNVEFGCIPTGIAAEKISISRHELSRKMTEEGWDLEKIATYFKEVLWPRLVEGGSIEITS